eukprot:TRINITY_DN4593_c0_g1_i1.p1 TRINITY_DN4593_c0_g1~~TRINITY_DN4593_c0_g1_i1.p1  ORF type:complete len:328 (+),score=49.72 TRINITY_DN4593_c0_g1_i1:130-1113(+)
MARLPPRLLTAIWMGLAVILTGSHSFLLSLAKDSDGRIPFNSAAVVTLQEAGKLLVCLIAGRYRHRMQTKDILYAVPALLYAFNNNVAILLQHEMDPATFQILCNFKTVTTCLFMFLLLNRRYPWQKWGAAVLIFTAGVVNSSSGLQHADDGWQAQESFVTPFGLLLMLVYCASSGFAGAYSEWVMKKHAAESLWTQGFKMYLFGAAINALGYVCHHEPGSILQGFTPLTWLIVAGQVTNGLLYAAILKTMSNIARLLVVGAAMILAAVLAQSGLHVHLSAGVWVACALTVLAYVLYYLPTSSTTSNASTPLPLHTGHGARRQEHVV